MVFAQDGQSLEHIIGLPEFNSFQAEDNLSRIFSRTEATWQIIKVLKTNLRQLSWQLFQKASQEGKLKEEELWRQKKGEIIGSLFKRLKLEIGNFIIRTDYFRISSDPDPENTALYFGAKEVAVTLVVGKGMPYFVASNIENLEAEEEVAKANVEEINSLIDFLKNASQQSG